MIDDQIGSRSGRLKIIAGAFDGLDSSDEWRPEPHQDIDRIKK